MNSGILTDAVDSMDGDQQTMITLMLSSYKTI